MKIIIDQIPPSLNRFAGRQNVWEYRKLKKQWTALVYYNCISKSDKTKQPFNKSMVKITYYFEDKRRRDPDNFAGKLILDGLTAAGVIKDDSFANITLVLEGKYDKQNPRTEIEITEIKEKKDEK